MVEGARLEIVWAGDRLGGSNPLASATLLTQRIKKQDSFVASLQSNPLASVIFYVWKSKKYTHAIWHFMVLAGTIMHFFAVLFGCVLN